MAGIMAALGRRVVTTRIDERRRVRPSGPHLVRVFLLRANETVLPLWGSVRGFGEVGRGY